MRDVSVIIPSFNTRDITRDCLTSLIASMRSSSRDLSYEIIVVDNASSDGSADMLKDFAKSHADARISFIPVFNTENVGYSKGNNIGLSRASGAYILYLNSDVVVDHVDFAALVGKMEQEPTVGGLTVRVNLPDGAIDPASHRGFPTIWRSMTYLTGLERTLGKIDIFKKPFGGYHLLHLNLDTEHDIDAATGAFFMTRKMILDRLGGFDEDYFMYGEDLDLCYRIREIGYRIVYMPEYRITHLKYKSGLSSKSEEVRARTRKHFHEAMKLFYRKHYAKLHSSIVNGIMYALIDLRSKLS